MTLIGDALRGAMAGAIATWLMDLTTSGMLQAQAPATTRREEAARPNGKGAVENLVDRIDSGLGWSLPESQRSLVIQLVHLGLGIGPGAFYGVLRGRVPLVGSGAGVAYGVLLWALNDEYLNTTLGLARPFDAHAAETHWRGLVGHVVLGAATDTGIVVLGG
jgi:hypothetical protein